MAAMTSFPGVIVVHGWLPRASGRYQDASSQLTRKTLRMPCSIVLSFVLATAHSSLQYVVYARYCLSVLTAINANPHRTVLSFNN